MLGLEVMRSDRTTKRGEVAFIGSGACYETLDHGAEEGSRAARWLHQMQGTKIAVGGVPGQIEQHLDYPSTGEHLAIVLGTGGYESHGHSLGTATDGLLR